MLYREHAWRLSRAITVLHRVLFAFAIITCLCITGVFYRALTVPFAIGAIVVFVLILDTGRMFFRYVQRVKTTP